MEQEKINKIVELSNKKEQLEELLKYINRDNVHLRVEEKVENNFHHMDFSNNCTATPYLNELHKRFVTMVLVDISDIENELESL